MRKAALFLAILCLAPCGGRTANPTSAYKFGDEDLTCEELEYEFSKVERDIRARYGEWKGNSDSNVALGVAGAVLLWPVLFAIDNGNAEEAPSNERPAAALERVGYVARLGGVGSEGMSGFSCLTKGMIGGVGGWSCLVIISSKGLYGRVQNICYIGRRQGFWSKTHGSLNEQNIHAFFTHCVY